MLVLSVAVGIYVFSIVFAMREAAAGNVDAELRDWRMRLAWVEERLVKARRENWDHEMVGSLLTEQRIAVARVAGLELRLAEKLRAEAESAVS